MNDLLSKLATTALHSRLLPWFATSGRHDLPWQQPITPYRVWVSEIMLQQTQVATVIPYFKRFMARFPTIADLASAPLDDVLHHWAGLGYYARARNLHRSAQLLQQHYNGQFPTTLLDMMILPGIGRSTAGAILSLALQQPHPILDGNVKRVLARTHAIDTWPGEKHTQQQLWELATHYTPTQAEQAATYTQAIMDLGATVCKRVNPVCSSCPLHDICRGQTTPTVFPGRKPKKCLPTKHTHFVILQLDTDTVLLVQRPNHGIWGGLWCFPECNTDDIADWVQYTYDVQPTQVTPFAKFRHTFSHYHLAIQASVVTLEKTPTLLAQPAHIWYNLTQPAAVGLAKPIKSLLTTLYSKRFECRQGDANKDLHLKHEEHI